LPLRAGFGPNFEKRFGRIRAQNAEHANKRLSFTVSSSYKAILCSLMRTLILLESDEFALVGVIPLPCCIFFPLGSYWLQRLQILFKKQYRYKN